MEQGRKRRRTRSADPAVPPPVPAAEDALPDVDGFPEQQEQGEEQEELTPEHQEHHAELAAAAARAEARHMLRDPTWVQYAEDMLAYCEDGLLQDVGQLFPSEEQFVNRDTYRFQKLYHQFPGATFGRELLKPDPEERIDLSKVLLCLQYSLSELESFQLFEQPPSPGGPT